MVDINKHFRYESFKDNTQQDSAELLRCLLDGIRKEEMEVNCYSILTFIYGDLPVEVYQL